MINVQLTYEETTDLIAGIFAHRATGRASGNKYLETYCQELLKKLLQLTKDHHVQETQHDHP